jgi:hypothetical protein
MNSVHRACAVRRAVAVLVFVVAILPGRSDAAGCDEWLDQTVRLTGTYVPAGESYARSFVFAMLVECGGGREVVTVQRATGTFPVCGAQESVAVVGKLVWNKALVRGHYEINNPTTVTCEPADRARISSSAPAAGSPVGSAPPAPVAQPSGTESTPGGAPVLTPTTGAAPPAKQTVAMRPAVWVGRYSDSRGAGEVTFTLIRGESVVSGTWKLRTGGGGPISGAIAADGHRMTFRMENIVGGCPGTFEGTSEITDTTLVATYHGKDCEGPVNDGRLELRAQ